MPVNDADTSNNFVDDDAELIPEYYDPDVIDPEYVDVDEGSEDENVIVVEPTTPDEKTAEPNTDDQDEEEPLPHSSTKESLTVGILSVVFILTLVLGCGGYLYFYGLPRNGDLEERTSKEAKLRHNAVESYKQLILKDFPNWQLIGDDFDESDLGSEKRVLITAHIRKESDDRALTIVLQKLKVKGLNEGESEEYWFAYRPSLNQLKDIEIDKAKREALPEQ